MKAKISIFLLLIGASTPSWSNILSSKEGRESLEGVDGFLVVATLPAVLKEHGQNVQRLWTTLQLRLRREGIRVYTGEEPNEARKKMAILSFDMNVTVWDMGKEPDDGGAKIFVFAVQLSVVQPVLLVRDKTVYLPAVTWNRMGSGFMGELALAQSKVEDFTDTFMDELINDYLAVNPITGSK